MHHSTPSQNGHSLHRHRSRLRHLPRPSNNLLNPSPNLQPHLPHSLSPLSNPPRNSFSLPPPYILRSPLPKVPVPILTSRSVRRNRPSPRATKPSRHTNPPPSPNRKSATHTRTPDATIPRPRHLRLFPLLQLRGALLRRHSPLRGRCTKRPHATPMPDLRARVKRMHNALARRVAHTKVSILLRGG